MPAADDTPTIDDVIGRLNAILEGDASRAAVADWAGAWIAAEPSTITDPRLWQLLRLAASVDLRMPGGEGAASFLHSDADIRDWVDSLGA